MNNEQFGVGTVLQVNPLKPLTLNPYTLNWPTGPQWGCWPAGLQWSGWLLVAGIFQRVTDFKTKQCKKGTGCLKKI